MVFWSFFKFFIYFLFFDLQSQSPYSIPHLCPAPPPSFSPTTQTPLPFLFAYCTVRLRTHPSLSVCLYPCLSSCLLSCCLSLVLPRVLSLVPVFPILSICLSLSQLFHLFHYFFLCHLHYFASCSLTFSASQQTF